MCISETLLTRLSNIHNECLPKQEINIHCLKLLLSGGCLLQQLAYSNTYHLQKRRICVPKAHKKWRKYFCLGYTLEVVKFNGDFQGQFSFTVDKLKVLSDGPLHPLKVLHKIRHDSVLLFLHLNTPEPSIILKNWPIGGMIQPVANSGRGVDEIMACGTPGPSQQLLT